MEHRKIRIRSEMSAMDKIRGTKVGPLDKSSTVETKQPRSTYNWDKAVIKVNTGITLSIGYQSVRVDVGLDLPWKCSETSWEEDVKEGFSEAYRIIDTELEERSKEINQLLQELVKKHSR